MPFFSIIVPTFNRASSTRKMIASLEQQGFKDFEVIIVDDGSDDNTREVLTPLFTDTIQYFYIPNQERAHARNYGLQKAKGTYINYFDSDDRFYDNRLETIFNFIYSHDLPDVVFSHYNFEDVQGNITGHLQRHYTDFSSDILYNNFLATNAVFLKREIALNNLFHEGRALITAEDWELWLRVSVHHKFAECKEKTFAIVQHPGRSLEKISPEKIEMRDTYFACLVKDHAFLREAYTRNQLELFVADRYTFIALTFAVVKKRKKAILYLVRSALHSWRVMGRRRFWGVIKNLR